ncbi:DUF4307 domain-containing protein [Glycomyces salinus]|uniref:DUF4307 domain-containing protein n=1 Tax=Glycomyces salinus TaxID=980294 RepID=UPI0018EDA526|nr:DUF4307 domain-containing protein [Glycomyces salinus]
MSETLTTGGRAPAGADVSFPEGRYGRRRERRRRRPALAAGLTALVVVGGIGAAVMLQDNYGQGDYSTNLLAYDDSVQGHVEITFEVYKPAGEGAVCRVRSRDLAGAEVGAAEVVIAPGEATRVVTSYPLAVTGEPNSGEVQRCWAAD